MVVLNLDNWRESHRESSSSNLLPNMFPEEFNIYFSKPWIFYNFEISKLT